MTVWQNRTLDRIYPVLSIDAILRLGPRRAGHQRPVHVAISVSVNDERGILGLWAGDGREGVKSWLPVLTGIKNHGVEDLCITVCDGFKGLPEAITTVCPGQWSRPASCDLIRNTFHYAARQSWDEVSRDLHPV